MARTSRGTVRAPPRTDLSRAGEGRRCAAPNFTEDRAARLPRPRRPVTPKPIYDRRGISRTLRFRARTLAVHGQAVESDGFAGVALPGVLISSKAALLHLALEQTSAL